MDPLRDGRDEFIPLFTVAIRLETKTDLQIERLKKRERKRFGTRIDAGGDLYETPQHFLDWSTSYAQGD